jgi:hypothetical protein
LLSMGAPALLKAIAFPVDGERLSEAFFIASLDISLQYTPLGFPLFFSCFGRERERGLCLSVWEPGALFCDVCLSVERTSFVLTRRRRLTDDCDRFVHQLPG